jgi:exoribonuclease R
VAHRPDAPLHELLRGLDHAVPRDAAFLDAARGAMEPAGYTAFVDTPPGEPGHAAIACPYTHVTAPLRRLADRYAVDLAVTLAAGGTPTAAQTAVLEPLAKAMNEAEARQRRFERALVDAVEARVLERRRGEVFDAVVVRSRDGGATVQIPEPPVRTTLKADPAPAAGTRIRVRLVEADPARRRVVFAPAE